MWLLHATTKKLHFFTSEQEVPSGYAILSHTWGDEEVLFHELNKKAARRKTGYAKIEHTCRQALEDGLSWAWVDTCRYLPVESMSHLSMSHLTYSDARLHRQKK